MNITVTKIDGETVGMEVTVEGDSIDYSALKEAIENGWGPLHSIYEMAVGSRTVEHVRRSR